MTTTLVLTGTHLESIREAAAESIESAAVILAKPVPTTNGNLRLVVQDIAWVLDDAYEQRDEHGLVVTSAGFVPALGRAANLGATAIWMHTHPDGGSPTPSRLDRIVDEQLAELFRLRTRAEHYGALIFSVSDDGLSFSGYLSPEHGRNVPIDRVWATGERFQLLNDFNAGQGPSLAAFDRNIRAFGPEAQVTLRQLHVGIVGAGGTGSAVAEQLVRLGIRRFTLIDHDELDETNLTRVYGSFPEMVGRSKVEVLRDHLRHIDPSVVVRAVPQKVIRQDAARQLDDCDVVFGCTDDNAGRVVLSRLASILLTPVIDVGVTLDSHDGVLAGVYGRVTILSAGAACLICRDRINMRMASAEIMGPEERARRVAEGYAPELPGVQPAVVTFTTMTAAQATSELLNRLTGFGGYPYPGEILIFPHDHMVRANGQEPRTNHYCDPNSSAFGSAITQPYLGLTWAD